MAATDVQRRLIYSVAASLDGYIARDDGSYDWIPEEPDIDWGAFLGRFDTMLMGRHTYEVLASQDIEGPMAAMEHLVFSRTLDPSDHPEVRIAREDPAQVLAGLRDRPGKDIWLMGGGQLFRSCLDRHLVDRIEVAVTPVLLGSGLPLLPPGEGDTRLALADLTRYPRGIVLLGYDVLTDG